MKRFTKYPTNYVKANTINRYSDVVPYEKRRYWYFTTHGYGPGSLPKDVAILETREGQNKKGTWGDFICLDSVLNTSELRQYDLIELAPEDVKSACGKKKVSASYYEEWDGYVDPEIILENSDVPNIEESEKLAEWIHQCEYTSGFATLTDFFRYFDLDDLYADMLEEIGG